MMQTRTRRNLGNVVCIALSILTTCAPAVFGTAIVGLRAPRGFVIAADSKPTYMGPGRKGPPTVCKIFQFGALYFSVEGLAEDSRRNFSPERIVANNFSFADSLAHNMDVLEKLLSESLKTTMERMKTEDLDTFAFNHKPGSDTMAIIAGEMVGGSPQMSGRGFTYQERSPNITIKRSDCPGEDCPTGTRYFFAGESDVAQPMATDFFRSIAPRDPVADARSMVEVEIKAHPKTVGPPITVLRVDENGASWPSNDAGCPIEIANTLR
jgi:hypothetical protein